MQSLNVPYGHSFMTADIPEKNFAGYYFSALPDAVENESAEVCRALDNPIDSPPLEELAKGKKNAVIITSDHTRPVPSKIIMPQILERLRRNAPDIDITILVATGFHRATTETELIAKLGEKIVREEKIVVHDSGNASMLCDAGILPSGGKLMLNKLAMETELLVAEGFIEPHFFAGFSGGRKSVLPGIASRTTVLANHCAEFIASPFARTGILDGNPIHRDMLFAAEKAKLAFIVNVVINGEKKIVRAFSGDREKAHLQGCDFLRASCRISVPEVDIVITGNGGYPLDQNVYQSVKGMTSGEAVCRENGVIIMVASCADGHGGEAFCRTLTRASSPAGLLAKLAGIPRDQTEPDQWQTQILLRILMHAQVIYISDAPDETVRAMHMTPAHSVGEALEIARTLLHKTDLKITAIPDGVSVIVKPISK